MGKSKNRIRQGLQRCHPCANKTTQRINPHAQTKQQEHSQCGTEGEKQKEQEATRKRAILQKRLQMADSKLHRDKKTYSRHKCLQGWREIVQKRKQNGKRQTQNNHGSTILKHAKDINATRTHKTTRETTTKGAKGENKKGKMLTIGGKKNTKSRSQTAREIQTYRDTERRRRK